MAPKNVLVAQSGGPSAVINNSIRGVIDACQSYPELYGRIYGAWHGIEGVLREELLDITAQDPREIRLLETTPAAGAIGTCRYKLKLNQKEDFARIIAVLKAHNIGWFFYAGGNDSMDTANRIAELAHQEGLDLVATGVPKTIDNDVGDSEFKLVDHTPGYGSTARYWASNVLCANEENAGSCPADPVLVLQAMGRRIGFIPAAVRLADPQRKLPIQIYLPEAGITLPEMADLVNDELKRSKRCIVVVSEGCEIGSLGEVRDAFGHVNFSASETTVQQQVVTYLNKVGLSTTGKARGQVVGTDQRHNIFTVSEVDLREAYASGQYAVEISRKFGNGYMATILRAPTTEYQAIYDKVPLCDVANSERTFPKKWIAPSRIDVTDEFIQYAQPLIGVNPVAIPMENGLPRFTRFQPIFAEQKLPSYIPQAIRSNA